jgi:hypothetical protein
MRRFEVSAALVILLSGASAMAQQPFEVRWANERLTVRAADAPQADVLAEVARLTGIEVVGREKITGRLTVEVTEAPLDDGLAKVLDGVNYVLLERPATPEAGARRWVLRVHSLAGASPTAGMNTGPIHVPALDALVAAEAEDAEDEAEIDEDDPDADDDARAERVQAAKLTSQGAFGPKAALPALLKLSENYYNDFIRLAAIKALADRTGSEVVLRLVKALGDEALPVRKAAVESLGRSTDAGSVQLVGQLLGTNSDRDARVAALRVLALRASPDSIPHLTAVLKDPDASIRDAAGQLLAELERRQAASAARR